MSKLNMFSIESIDTYNKFKLQDGNLYMNNNRVGIEEFHGGKNIDISDHRFNLTDNINISGDMVVDNNMTVKGTIFANLIDMEFFEVNAAKINILENVDISTEFIKSNDLSIHVNNELTLVAQNSVIHIADLSINTNDLSMNSRNIQLDTEIIHINDGFTIEKNGRYFDICLNLQIIDDFVTIKNLKVENFIQLPANLTQGETFDGPIIAESDVTISGGLFTSLRIDAVGIHSFIGDNTLTGNNTLNGTTSIDNLQLQNGFFQDISVASLNVTSECDVFIKNGSTFRIRNATDICMIDVYDWNPDLSNNLYYNGNVIIGSNLKTIDASLNVFGPVDMVGVLDVIGSVDISGTLDICGDIFVSGTINVSEEITVLGNVNAANFNRTSDLRLKSNISDLTNGLNIIRKIKPKLYDKMCGSGHIKESGVIAQDILEIDELGYLVSEHKGMYGLNYNSLHMYSLLGVQELDKKLSQIEQHLALIDQKLNILYRRR